MKPHVMKYKNYVLKNTKKKIITVLLTKLYLIISTESFA